MKPFEAALASLLLLGSGTTVFSQTAPPVPDARDIAPGDGTLDLDETDAAADVADPFALDPNVAFEAYNAGNYERAFDLAVTFAGRGDAPAMRLLGTLYESGSGVPRDGREAAEWYRLAAEGGDTEGQVLYATTLLDGVLVERDDAKAAEYLRLASDTGNATALQMLGVLTLEGRGIERDVFKAASLIKEAAELGNNEAQYTLGILYQEGAGVRQDNDEALRWFEAAARNGNNEAQVEVAMSLLTDASSNAEDQSRLEDAIFWFRRAAEAGNPIAENRLAHAHAQGIVVRLDPVQAAYYHYRATASGLADPSLDSFVAALTDAQRTEAQAMIDRDLGPANPFDRQTGR